MISVTRIRRLAIAAVGIPLCFTLAACWGDSADSREAKTVNKQQDIYSDNQPIPVYDWSLPRDLWIRFYDAQNRAVTTYAFIRPFTGGAPAFDCAAQGYALPRDTQLTNPLRRDGTSGAVLEQAEPNGLFTSKNTNQTVIFCTNPDGTVSPVVSEEQVTAFPFPVKWETDSDHPNGHWVRVGSDATIKLKLQTTNPKKPVTRVP